VDVDHDTFITVGYDRTVRKWNKTTCEGLCFATARDSILSVLTVPIDKSRVLCGLSDGGIEMRRANDLGLISLFEIHSTEVWSISQLNDGSFVSASTDSTVKRWDENGMVIQTFSEDLTGGFVRVIELTSDVIVASSLDTTLIWKVSTGDLLRKTSLRSEALIKLSNDKFVTGSTDNMIHVWNGITGECIETITSDDPIEAMTRVGDSILTTSGDLMEVRRLKYYSIISLFFLFLFLF